MTDHGRDRKIDYIEFPCTDLPAAKKFYTEVFGWEFQDYGPNYTSFHDGRISGGMFAVPKLEGTGPLVVVYANHLEGMQAKVIQAGGSIIKQIFSFPGGRRFHFTDPCGGILAVWSDAA